MLTQADDDGRLVADPGQLRLLAWGYHEEVSEKDVSAALEEIAGFGLIRHYTVAGVPYADFPSWGDHQRINRPTPSKLPPYQSSLKAQGPLTEDSLRAHAGSEGIKDQGSEGKEGRECEGGTGDASPEPPLSLSQKGTQKGRFQQHLDTIRDQHPEWAQAQVEAEGLRTFASVMR
jgi:hypothetical protein